MILLVRINMFDLFKCSLWLLILYTSFTLDIHQMEIEIILYVYNVSLTINPINHVLMRTCKYFALNALQIMV